jgi:hypothetical protein
MSVYDAKNADTLRLLTDLSSLRTWEEEKANTQEGDDTGMPTREYLDALVRRSRRILGTDPVFPYGAS